MSKISTLYDRVVVLLGTNYTPSNGYLRLPNVQEIEKNPVGFLRKGFGFFYGGSSGLTEEFNSFSTDHVFSFAFTREIAQMEGEFSDYDTEHKGLLEDIKTLKSVFYDQNALGLYGIVEISQIQNESNIQTVNSAEGMISFITVDIIFRVNENIPC